MPEYTLDLETRRATGLKVGAENRVIVPGVKPAAPSNDDVEDVQEEVVEEEVVEEPEEEKPQANAMIKSSRITVAGKPFATWFNDVFKPSVQSKTQYFKNRTNADGFKKVFDELPGLTGKQEVTLNEFVAHFCIIYNELGGTFAPKTENGDDAYFFEKRGEKKASYNGLYQRFAGNQMSNKANGNDHPALGTKAAGWGKLTRQVDIDAWNSKTKYPVNPPAGSAFNATQWASIKTFARNCDFYKFRGRGLQQLTLRGNYRKHADPFLKAEYGKKSEDMTNAELDAAFKNPAIYVPAFRSFHRAKMEKVGLVNENPPKWGGYAMHVGGEKYVTKFTERCTLLFDAIKKAGYKAS